MAWAQPSRRTCLNTNRRVWPSTDKEHHDKPALSLLLKKKAPTATNGKRLKGIVTMTKIEQNASKVNGQKVETFAEAMEIDRRSKAVPKAGSSIPATATPTPEPKAERLASEIAIPFLKDLDPDGRHHLMALDPEEKSGPVGLTFGPEETDDAAAFIDRLNGVRNLYFTPNEPKAGAPNKKLTESDIANLRAVYADVDAPRDNGPEAQKALAETAGLVQSSRLPPTATVLTGGGLQLYWKLKEKLPAGEWREQAKSQGRAHADWLSGDKVQSIEHLMRLPGTLNIPTKSKRAKGRVPFVACLESQDADRVYTLEGIGAIVKPIRAGENGLDNDQAVRECQASLDMGAIESLDVPTDLPEELKAKFAEACERNPELKALWLTGEVQGDDQSGSVRRAALARHIGRAGGFTSQDYGSLVWVWQHSVQAGDDRETKITSRTIAREWVRLAGPFLLRDGSNPLWSGRRSSHPRSRGAVHPKRPYHSAGYHQGDAVQLPRSD